MKIGNHLEFRLFKVNMKIVFSWLAYMITSGNLLVVLSGTLGSPLGYKAAFSTMICSVSFVLCLTLGLLYLIAPKGFTLRVVIVVFGIISGVIMGHISGLTLVSAYRTMVTDQLNFLLGDILATVFIIALPYSFILFWEYITETKRKIHDQQLKKLLSERRMIEAQLKILQAQIEPHFLFNTLSNILSLFDIDIKKAKAMQSDLINYLDTSLSKLRVNSSTIGLEIEMTVAYLNIFKVRMGDRLKFNIDVPKYLEDLAYPPMLIQPLVENAIKHGLEPKIEGGEISINVELINDTIRVLVIDTGMGLEGDMDQSIGLSNTRERLNLIYGDAGKLWFEKNDPTGLKAIIEVPCLYVIENT